MRRKEARVQHAGTVTAAEQVETYEELDFRHENVRREAKGDINRALSQKDLEIGMAFCALRLSACCQWGSAPI